MQEVETGDGGDVWGEFGEAEDSGGYACDVVGCGGDGGWGGAGGVGVFDGVGRWFGHCGLWWEQQVN